MGTKFIIKDMGALKDFLAVRETITGKCVDLLEQVFSNQHLSKGSTVVINSTTGFNELSYHIKLEVTKL